MNKTIKRLLSGFLALVMAIALIPFNAVMTVNAANDSAPNMTVYLQVTEDWTKDGAAFRAYLWDTGHPDTDGDGTYYKPFQPVDGVDRLYSVTLNSNSCYRIKVARCTSDYLTEWNSFILNFYERSSDSVNKITVTGGSAGKWDGTYTPSGAGDVDTPAEGTFYVDTDLVDYFNDSRVESGATGYSADNQGAKSDDMMGQDNVVPYSYFNGVISNKLSSNSAYYKFPLYFGSLLFTNNRVGRTATQTPYSGNLNKWSSTVNVALSNGTGDKDDNDLDASVQGLVDNTLDGGKLTSNGNELPYFSQTQASSLNVSGKKVMEYYAGFKFPFKSSYNSATGVTTYSYDSETDYAVYRNWDNVNDKVLKTSNTHILNNDGKNGYYPLNKETDSGDAVNYGFGTKFTIPFTINENGTIDGTANGDPVTFTFTGDDDVWVFLDGNLILDMGGAHAKSTGTINFKTLQAVVEDAATATNDNTQVLQSGATNSTASYKDAGLYNYVWDLAAGEQWGAQERSTVASKQMTKNFSDYGTDFVNRFKDSSNTHTLVMFYMERGMFDSNMKVEFTINPLPSGLSLSKTLDVSGVNTGLAEAVQEADNDNFNFAIQTKDLKDTGATYQNVENLGYSLNNYNNQDTAGYKATDSVITGVGARSFAHTFINTSTGKDAFKGGTAFKITEDQDSSTVFEYDYTKTKWTVYDKDNNYAVIDTYDDETEDRLTAEFNMGSSTSTDFDTFDYDVNFRNTLKVNTLSLTKKWNQSQTAPSNGEYSFTVLIDLDGEDKNEYGYKAYTLDGDNGDTDASGKITLAADETVVFTGIPVGSSYKIIENIPEDANYSSDQTDNTVTGTIAEDSAASVTFTNKTNVGTATVTKAWSTGTAPADTEFDFKVETSTDGTTYEPYASKEYTSSLGDTRKGTTGADGSFEIKANETITFADIPAGTKVKFTEITTTGTGWAVDGSASAEVTIVADETENATITNKTTTTNVTKVVYAEAGSDPTAYTPSDVTITKATLTSGQTDGAKVEPNETTSNQLDIVAPTANEKYVYTIEGTSDGKILDSNSTLIVYSFKAADKVYVFDYGLDSNLTETKDNNGLFQDGVYFNAEAEKTKANADDSKYSTTATLRGITQNATADGVYQTSITADDSVTINDSEGAATGNVICSIGDFMDRVETYKYQVDIKRDLASVTLNADNPETGTVVTGNIEVMPANVVYYEDNFDGINYEANGGVVTKSGETDSKQSNANDTIHGNDIVYNDSNNESDGVSTKLERTDDGIPTFSFSFKGTGFDIVGRTNTTSAKLTVVVEDESEKLVKSGVVDTYYANGDLYQIPVISIRDLDYKQYTVKVAVVSSTNGGSVFYLDGIRIYNPMEDTSEYPDEAEQNVEFANIHQLLVGKGTISEDRYDDGTILSVTADDSKMVLVSYDADEKKAVLYGDTNTEDQGNKGSSTYSASLVDYLNKGPNNEVYLDPNVGIAFDVKGTDVKTIQVEAKKIDITSNEDPETDAEKSFSLMKADGTLVSLEKVESKTAMYYNIPVSSCISIDGGYRVILVAHDTVSLSNLKYTEECEVSVPETTDYLTRPEVDPTDDGYEYQAQIEEISFSPSAKALKAEKRVKITVTLDDETDFDHFVAYLVPDTESVDTDSDEYMVELIRDSDTDLTYRFYAPEVKGKYNFILIPVDKDDNRSCYQKSVAVKVK